MDICLDKEGRMPGEDRDREEGQGQGRGTGGPNISITYDIPAKKKNVHPAY